MEKTRKIAENHAKLDSRAVGPAVFSMKEEYKGEKGEFVFTKIYGTHKSYQNHNGDMVNHVAIQDHHKGHSFGGKKTEKSHIHATQVKAVKKNELKQVVDADVYSHRRVEGCADHYYYDDEKGRKK